MKTRLIANYVWTCLGSMLFLLNACNFRPPGSESDPDIVRTYAAETIAANAQQATIVAMEAQLTSQAQTLQAPTATPIPTEPLPTTALPLPSETPPTLPTLAPPVLSPTPVVILLTADIDTRCRQGPSTLFATISFISVGQEAQVLGKNPENTWWLIRDPQGRFGNCWVWGETTRLMGDSSLVPVVQPPPVPTPVPSIGFQAAYANFHICGGVAVAVFMVGNNSTVEFKSSNLTVRDLTNDIILSGPESSNSPFLPNASACPPGFSTLAPGDNAYVAKGMGMLPPAGTRGRGIIVLCTQPNLGGQCAEQRVNFTFP